MVRWDIDGFLRLGDVTIHHLILLLLGQCLCLVPTAWYGLS